MKRLSGCISALLLFSVWTAAAGTAAGRILDQYYLIHDRLAADSVSQVAEAAAAIARMSREAAQQETAGRDKLLALSEAAAKMKTSDLKTAREGFGELSRNLTAYLQAAGVQPRPNQFFCSMAGKGWLQADNKIRNPYYGSSMLSCGELLPPAGR